MKKHGELLAQSVYMYRPGGADAHIHSYKMKGPPLIMASLPKNIDSWDYRSNNDWVFIGDSLAQRFHDVTLKAFPCESFRSNSCVQVTKGESKPVSDGPYPGKFLLEWHGTIGNSQLLRVGSDASAASKEAPYDDHLGCADGVSVLLLHVGSKKV